MGALSGKELLKDQSPIYDFYSPVYNFFISPFFNFGYQKAIEKLNIQPGQKLLDVGCGTGQSFAYFSPHCQGKNVTLVGMDLSRGMLKQAQKLVYKKEYDFAHLGCCDGQVLPFPDESFDSAFAAYTFSVVPDPGVFLREVLRVTKPGGKIVFMNHLKSKNRWLQRLEEIIDPVTRNIGWQMKEDLREVFNTVEIRNYQEFPIKTNPIFRIISFEKP